jgi:hypothetical protein
LSTPPAAAAPAAASPELAQRPPQPPRPLTPHARRHSWAEGRVRVWWVAGLVLTVIAAGYVSSKIARSSRGRWLVTHGIKGKAELLQVGGETLKDKTFPADSRLLVTMNVMLPGEQPYKLENVTLPDHREPVVCRSTIDIYVDPADHTRFTTFAKYSVMDDLLIASVLAPPIVLVFAVALVIRRRLLNLWRTGEAAVAVVVDTRSSPIAPLSQLVRFTLRDTRAGTLFQILVPNRFGPLQRGDPVWVITHPRHPARSIVAGLYQ